MLLDIGWNKQHVEAVYKSWNNPEHYDLVIAEDGSEVYVPNSKMVLPVKHDGDDTTIMDKHSLFDTNNVALTTWFAAFNSKYSTSWVPSNLALDHSPLGPIDTLSTLYFPDVARDAKDGCKKILTTRPDFATPHPVKKGKSIMSMLSPTNIKLEAGEDGETNVKLRYLYIHICVYIYIYTYV